MGKILYHIIPVTVLTAAICFLFATKASAGYFQQPSPAQKTDTLKYPIQDRRGDYISNPRKNPIDLKDPSNIQRSVEYDPKTREYYIIEKIGNNYYRKPTFLTFDEYLRIKAKEQEDEYFHKRANVLTNLNKKNLRPKLIVSDNLFNRIFGNGKSISVHREMSISLPVTRDRISRIQPCPNGPGKMVVLILI